MEGMIKDSYNEFLKSLPSGTYELVVKKKTNTPDKRSIQQNKYIWGVIYKIVSEESGYTDEEVHEIFKTLFLKRYVSIGKKEIRITKSTTELDTNEFNEYCESIRVWCSFNLNLNIPEPNEVEYETTV